MVITLLLLACRPIPEDSGVEDPPLPRMDDLSLLARRSLDLRGVRPSLEEVAAVQADPAALETLTDDFLDDPRFEERLVDAYAALWRTRIDQFDTAAVFYGIEDDAAFEQAVGEEPLRLLARIVAEDRPYSELVTGDWTMANEMTRPVWPLDDDDPTVGWRPARYTDGRPAAGVLATNAFSWRYGSTASNANRGRANQAFRLLLCEDYLSREVEFSRDVNLLDEEAVKNALQTEPGCVACHVTLDPLASHFWGFYYVLTQEPLETSVYHPEREEYWQYTTGVAPGYAGEPTWSLADLGQHVAADPRFLTCAVEEAWGVLLKRPPGLDEDEELYALRETLLAADLRLKPVLRQIVELPAYTSGPTDNPRGVPLKLAAPDLLASAVADLTGFRLRSGGYDLLTTDRYGVRTLGGGSDGKYATTDATAPNATVALVAQRLAEGAADHVVRNEPDRLALDVSAAPTLADLDRLHRRVLTEIADEDTLSADLDLWTSVRDDTGDPLVAWTAVLTALLRDPRFLLY